MAASSLPQLNFLATFASCFRLVVVLHFFDGTEDAEGDDTEDDAEDGSGSKLRSGKGGGSSSRSIAEMEGISLSELVP